MKKYAILIGIYALSIIYMIAYVMPIIAFNTGVYEDFFSKHYSLYYYGLPVVSFIFYVLFGISAICSARNQSRRNKRLLLICF